MKKLTSSVLICITAFSLALSSVAYAQKKKIDTSTMGMSDLKRMQRDLEREVKQIQDYIANTKAEKPVNAKGQPDQKRLRVRDKKIRDAEKMLKTKNSQLTQVRGAQIH